MEEQLPWTLPCQRNPGLSRPEPRISAPPTCPQSWGGLAAPPPPRQLCPTSGERVEEGRKGLPGTGSFQSRPREAVCLGGGGPHGTPHSPPRLPHSRGSTAQLTPVFRVQC